MKNLYFIYVFGRFTDRWPPKMEVTDNQHPIDLSRKCRYTEEPSSVCMARPLPDLIPISLFHEVSSSVPKRDRELFQCIKTCKQSLLGFQFKERLRERKESSRFRTVPHALYGSKTRKSKSETKISFGQQHNNTNTQYNSSPFSKAGSNYLGLPVQRNSTVAQLDRIRKYAEPDKNHNYVRIFFVKF